MNDNITNPVDLASEVLDDELGWEVKPGDTMHSEDAEALCRLANAAPILARAVARMGVLADDMEGYSVNLAAALNNGHTELDVKYDYVDHFARTLRAALNGETDG